ncbi:hypothetical protein Esti_001042 [Eimeria stiedai]
MEDLEALRAQFMSLQAAPQQQRISESTCLDVLQLLLQRQLLRLLPATNGKEFITPERLDQELRILKGRLSVPEAAQTLGFRGSAVAAALEALSKKMGGAFLLEEELVTSQYLQAVAGEATEILEEKGQLQLAELCQKHSLPLSFLKQEIVPRLNSSLGVTVRGSALETAAYAAHVTATARGLLLGASGPLQLSEAAKALKWGFPRKSGSGSWVELSPLLPPGLPEADVAAAVSLLLSPAAPRGSTSPPRRGAAAAAASQGLGLHALDGGLVVSEAFLSSLFDALRPLAEQKAKEAAAAKVATLKTAAASPAAPAAASQKQQQAKAPAAEESDWEAETKRKVRRGKAGKSSGGSAAAAALAASQQQQRQQQQQQEDQGLVMAEVDAAGIAFWDSLPDYAKEAFWGLLQPRIKEVLAAAVAACQASVLQQQQQKAAAEGELLQQDYERLCLGFRALEALGISETQEQQKPHPICAYFFKTKVVEAVDRLLLIAFRHATGEEVEVSSNNRQQLLSRLAGNGDKSSSTAAAALQQAAATAAKRDVQAMAQVLKKAASECFVHLRPPDKRRVKQLLFDQRTYWGGAAVAAAELRQYRRLFHAAANLLVLRTGVWMDFPEEDWALAAMVDLLQQHDEECSEAFAALQAFLKVAGTGKSTPKFRGSIED